MESQNQTGGSGFLMLRRSQLLDDLIKHHPLAFVLLTVIAKRARRTPCGFSGLKTNQALIGDYKECGLTRQNYRTSLRVLKANHLVTTKPTNKGTIATLCDATVYDINPERANQQKTTSQPTANQRLTTNNNVNNENNEKKEGDGAKLNEVMEHYNSVRGAMPECKKLTATRQSVIRARLREVGMDELKRVISSCADMPHLQGRNDRGWKADLEWIMKDNNFTKIIEGRYAARTERTVPLGI